MDQKTIDNNFKYHKPNSENVADFTDIRHRAKDLVELINYRCPESREKALAITKIEEAVMWANASIARSSGGTEDGE